MFWKKVILLLLVPVMFLSLGHLHVDTHPEHDDHICAHQTHAPHCDGCETDGPEKPVLPPQTTAPQPSQLRLLTLFIALNLEPRINLTRPRPLCIQPEHRAKIQRQERLLSVQFLT